MAFSFGNTSQTGFGTPQNKPTGFGTAFGATPTTTASAGFGAFGSSFNANPQPAFGSNTFGTPAAPTGAATAPSFGSSFGQAPVSSAPSFGTTFGAQTTSAPNFGTTFGQPSGAATNLFGGAQQTKPSLFGTPASTAPSLFSTPAAGGTNLFGGGVTTQPSLFGGGATTSTAPSLFGGGGTTTTSSLFGSSFGAAPSSANPSLFGTNTNTGFGAGANTGFGGGGLFGTASTTTPSLFGGFGSNTTTTQSGFPGFGTGNAGFGGFGTGGTSNLFGPKPTPQLSGAQSIAAKNQQVIASVYAINVFNDERDDILKKWNMLQASWGTGKGYYNSSQPAIDYNSQNPFYRFKAMGYNIIPEQDNSEGIVKLSFNKKISELRSQTDALKNGIGGILGNKPNLTVDIIQIKAISDTQTEVRIAVSEKGVTGSTRKIPASDLSAFLNQPTQKQQLGNVGVSQITPFVTPSKSELEEYLKAPPPGIDLQMWQAAIADNPNPKKYIPVAINGFSDLRSRMQHQENQTGLHQAFLEKVNKDISDLKTKHASSIAQIAELKQKFMELQHRILRILVKQESTRKVGLAIQPEEELMRGRLEVMHTQLNVPKQFKGQINELLSHVKMIKGDPRLFNQNYRIDADVQDEIKQFLKMEQSGIAQLVEIISTDLQAIKIINDGMQQILQQNGVNGRV